MRAHMKTLMKCRYVFLALLWQYLTASSFAGILRRPIQRSNCDKLYLLFPLPFFILLPLLSLPFISLLVHSSSSVMVITSLCNFACLIE